MNIELHHEAKWSKKAGREIKEGTHGRHSRKALKSNNRNATLILSLQGLTIRKEDRALEKYTRYHIAMNSHEPVDRQGFTAELLRSSCTWKKDQEKDTESQDQMRLTDSTRLIPTVTSRSRFRCSDIEVSH